MKKRIAGSAVWALAGLLGVAAHASASTPLPDGLYVIDANLYTGGDEYARRVGCMIISDSGRDVVPSVYDWGRNVTEWGQCGLSSDRRVMLQNRQAVWQIQAVGVRDHHPVYVIKSYVNGSCLIRGSNGYAENPSLHLWSELPGGDPKYCGFRNAQELIANGQAAWSLDAVMLTNTLAHVEAAWTRDPMLGFLGFSGPMVYPNTLNRSAFAAFTYGHGVWFFVFTRMDT